MRSCFVLVGVIFGLVSSGHAYARKSRTIYIDDKSTEKIFVKPGLSVILNFPAKPAEFVVGNDGLFSVKHVRNDLAVGALRPSAHSNLFVYLEGRRYGFNLITSSESYDEIIQVRDTSERKMKVRFKDE